MIGRITTMSHFKDFDVAMIVTGDSDLVPAVKYAKLINPNAKFRAIIPIGQKAKQLINACDNDKRKIKKDHMLNSQFDDSIVTINGDIITKPENW